MMKRPHSKPGTLQYSASDNAKSEPEDHIQIRRPDLCQILIVDAIRKSLALRFDLHHRNITQRSGKIN